MIASKLKQPLILGYLIGGILVGSVTSLRTVFASELLLFAEIGIALLMFLLGIEFSFRRFQNIGKVVVVGAILQILLVVFLGAVILSKLGLGMPESVFLAAVFSLSSTAVVIKLLTEKGLISTIPGEISVGWLLMQDLAVLPMVILLPALGFSTGELSVLDQLIIFGQKVTFGIIFTIGIFIVGKIIVDFIFNKLLKSSSRELLLLSAFTVCIILSGFSKTLGFSFALGAFLAGMLVAQTSSMQAVFSEVRPLRDLFATIFFVSLGLLFNPFFILQNWLQILFIVILIVILKFLIVFALTLSFGYHSKIAFLTGVFLIQVGEFAFILGQMGYTQKLINQTTYSLILSVAIITLLLTPFSINNSAKLYRFLLRVSDRFLLLKLILTNQPAFHNEISTMHDHVILLGYGRVGRYIGRALKSQNIPHVVIDYNRFVTDKLTEGGINAVYADPTNYDVLALVNCRKARAMVVTIPDFNEQEIAIGHAVSLNKKIKIYCRSHNWEDKPVLKKLAGNIELVQPEFEASLVMVKKIFTDMGFEKEDIEGKIVRLKMEHGMAT